MVAAYCGSCGKQFQVNETFCARCGTPREGTNVFNTTLVSPQNASTGRMSQGSEPANMMKATPAVCEVDDCGILAIGRCATCGRAFCAQHRGVYQGPSSLLPPRFFLLGAQLNLPAESDCINKCVLCFEELRARVAELPAVKLWQQTQDAEQFFKSGAARSTLLNGKVPPVVIYKVKRGQEWKRKGLLRREVLEQTEVATAIGYGWILGTFTWEYYVKGFDEGKSKVEGLTALLTNPDTLPDPYKDLDDPRYPLLCVQPYQGGYEALTNQDFLGNWLLAAQAVRRLIGPSS